uniref:Amino acid permease/ SLC12A domain-containing protein n=1 Tax=Ditylenchus dipsaci TaxID=166011 RepID=A0A915D614_9BILA
MDDERRTQISAQNLRLPSYGILESEVGAGGGIMNGSGANSATVRVLGDMDINLENLPGSMSNGTAPPNGPNEFESVISKRSGLSTVEGVFAPVTISMFSALLFLRMGFAAGQLGFLMTTVELLLAYSIILLTVLSLCAVSSNGAVEGGGVYYMISRTLGPEFGGSIGVLFFVANVFSCALYISGFTEALANMTGLADSYGGKFIHCVLVSVIILFLCLLGAEIFAKSAILALFVVILAYGCFLFTVFIKPAADIAIPKDNTMAYSYPKNSTDPDSEMILDLNQTLTARYTSFSVSTFKDIS